MGGKDTLKLWMKRELNFLHWGENECDVCFAEAEWKVVSSSSEEGTRVLWGSACEEHRDWLIRTHWKEGKIIERIKYEQ